MVEKRYFFIIVISFFILIAFQNCGPMAAHLGDASMSSAGAELPAAATSGEQELPFGATDQSGPQSSWEPARAPLATPGTFVLGKIECNINSFKREMLFKVLLPFNYQPQKFRYPLVVALVSRALGSSTEQTIFESEVNSVWNAGPIRQLFPAVIIVPQIMWVGDDWGQSYPVSSDSGFCGRLLAHTIAESYAVDTQRIYISGGAEGGSGTWDWLSREPNFFAAGIAQGGTVSSPQFASALLHTPILAYYPVGSGHEDKVMSLISSIHSLGGDQVKFVENQIGDAVGPFGPWNINLMRPGTINWLFSQRRK